MLKDETQPTTTQNQLTVDVKKSTIISWLTVCYSMFWERAAATPLSYLLHTVCDDGDVCICVCMFSIHISVYIFIHACSVRFCSGAHFTRVKKAVFFQVYRVHKRTLGYDPLIQVLNCSLASFSHIHSDRPRSIRTVAFDSED